MKLFFFFILLVAIPATAFSRDFRPATRLENIPLADSSIQQCVVFRTTAGVHYTVESSGDFVNWTPQDEIYGFGHEYVVTMREFTPPPAATPPVTPLAPAINASVRLQPAAGPAGGTLVSWRSLDHGGPMAVRIDGTMDVGWTLIPLFIERFGAYSFCVWHPGTVVTPPAANSLPGAKDAAMLAVLEASLPAMNQQILDSATRARNAPLPQPAAPGAKRFWRVKVDPELDTDLDGSPDWAEFQIATRGTGSLVPGVTGDAFNSDTNADGIPDGAQLDADLDSTPDSSDADSNDDAVVVPLGLVPRYALFEIPGRAIQINDLGTVIFPEKVWKGGILRDLPGGGPGAPLASARGINNLDVILGTVARDPEAGHYPASLAGKICFWPSPTADYQTMQVTDAGVAVTAYVHHDGFWTQGPAPIISDSGHFIAHGNREEVPEGYVDEFGGGPTLWQIPGAGVSVNRQAAPSKARYLSGPSLTWGHLSPFDPEKPSEVGSVHGPGSPPPMLFMPHNVISQPLPNGGVAIFATSAETQATQVFKNGGWRDSGLYANAIDIATDGVAIGRHQDGKISPILLNGKWTGIERTAPGVPLAWTKSDVKLTDVSPRGWVLAVDASNEKSAALLPIKVDGVNPDVVPPPLPPSPGTPPFDPPVYLAGGVDPISMSALAGTGRVPEIWIMAPTNGNNAVRFRSPLDPTTTLKLPSNFELEFEPEIIDSNNQVLQVKSLVPTGSFQPILKLGGTLNALNFPLKIKAMKKRTIKVAIHPVALKEGDDDAIYPSRIPSNSMEDRDDFKQQLTEYLDEVYGRQVNAFFNVAVMPSIEVDFDTVDPAGETAILAGNEFTPEMAIACTNPQWVSGVADIDIWILGGTVLTDGTQRVLGTKIGGTYGAFPQRQTPTIIVDGSDSVGRIIAHEMGHIFMGGGHPDVSTQNHFARLTGIPQEERLMKQAEGDHSECQLIKKEWDKIEEWLVTEIDDKEPK